MEILREIETFFHLHICTFTYLHIHMVSQLKKFLGLLWMLLAPVIVVIMIWQAAGKIQEASAVARTNAALQWIIILLVFIPICAGLFIFGRYSYNGEYDSPRQL